MWSRRFLSYQCMHVYTYRIFKRVLIRIILTDKGNLTALKVNSYLMPKRTGIMGLSELLSRRGKKMLIRYLSDICSLPLTPFLLLQISWLPYFYYRHQQRIVRFWCHIRPSSPHFLESNTLLCFLIDIWIHCPIHTCQTYATALLPVIQVQYIILA